MSRKSSLTTDQPNNFLSRTFERAEEKIGSFRQKFEKNYKDWLSEVLTHGTKALEDYEYELRRRKAEAIQKRKQGRRRASADSATGRRRARSPSGESVIEATSLTSLPTALELQKKVREETKMSGLSISSIKTPPPFTRPSFGNRVDHNANEEKHPRRASEPGTNQRRRSSDMMESPKTKEVVKSDGIDRNSENYHERTGLMRRSGRKSSVEKKLEQELNTVEPKLEEVVEQASYMVHEQQVFTDVQVEHLPEGMTKTNFVYSQPRLQPNATGSRVQKATGKLLNQYEEDQKFSYTGTDQAGEGEEEEGRASVSEIKNNLSKAGGKKSKEKEEMEKELAYLRATAAERMMGDDSSDDEKVKPQKSPEVTFRRPLTSIKTKYLAKTKGEKICTSSDSEDDHRKTPDKVEILGSSIGVKSVKDVYSTNEIPWQHPVEKHDPRKEIASSPFSESKKYYVENENMIPWQHPVEKFDPRQEINSPIVKSTIGYYKKIEGEVVWQHPVEKADPKAEIDRPVVKSTINYYKEIEGDIPWQHPVVRENPKQDIDSAVFSSAKTYYQKNEGVVQWQHPVEKMNAKDEIDTGNVQVASTYFKEIEFQKDNGQNGPIQKPVVSIVKNPFEIMAERKMKVDEYLDDEDEPSDHPSRKTNKDDVVYIDTMQIRQHRESYKRLEIEANKAPELSVHKPKTKLIADDEAFDVMAKHRKKSGEEDEDFHKSERRRASYEMEQRLEKEVNREIDVYQVRASRETYKTLESRTEDLSPVNKPRARYLGFDDAQLRMAEHRQRVEEGAIQMDSRNQSYEQNQLQQQQEVGNINVISTKRSTSISVSSSARQ